MEVGEIGRRLAAVERGEEVLGRGTIPGGAPPPPDVLPNPVHDLLDVDLLNLAHYLVLPVGVMPSLPVPGLPVSRSSRRLVAGGTGVTRASRLGRANKGPASVSRRRLWSIREHVEFWCSRSRDPVFAARLDDRGPNDRVIHFTWFTLIARNRETN